MRVSEIRISSALCFEASRGINTDETLKQGNKTYNNISLLFVALIRCKLTARLLKMLIRSKQLIAIKGCMYVDKGCVSLLLNNLF